MPNPTEKKATWTAPKLHKIAANLAEAGTGTIKDNGQGNSS